jgi:hypothetical protein
MYWTPRSTEGMTDESCNMITVDKVRAVRIYVFSAKGVALPSVADSGTNWDKLRAFVTIMARVPIAPMLPSSTRSLIPAAA